MARIGSARVSTLDQDLDIQLAKLKAEGCGVIRSEMVSGGSRDGRAELAAVLEFLRPGDELVVTRLDRLGRDTRDVLNLVNECEQREAFVTVLDPHVSTRGEMGHLVMTVLGMVTQMERRFIKERQRDGIERTKGEGTYVGGKRRLDRDRIRLLHVAGAGPAAITASRRLCPSMNTEMPNGGVDLHDEHPRPPKTGSLSTSRILLRPRQQFAGAPVGLVCHRPTHSSRALSSRQWPFRYHGLNGP